MMYNVNKKNEIVAELAENVKANVSKNLADLDLRGFMEGNNTDLVRESVLKIQANVTSAIPEGIPVPKASLYISPSGTDTTKISLITLTLTNKVKGNKKFKYSYAATIDNVKESILDFFLASYTELVVDYMIDENLEKVNEILAGAVKEADLSYEVQVVSPLGNEGKKIAYIGDDLIQFVAVEERILDMDDILIVSEASELVPEESIAEAKKQLAECLATAQTPEQLVGIHGGVLIEYVSDINKRVKPMTLIKKVCSRNAFKLTGNKDALAYYAEGNVFALVAKRDNKFEVVLTPFDVETLRKTDIDVVAEIEKGLAE